MKHICLIMVVLAFGVGTADAQQQRTFYDANGRVTGRAATDSQGTTTYYDSRGNVVGRSSK
ncbi:MAG TPA: hypothetical protein VGH47_04310 [Xanthobacteraceae bacterium]|jgi:YD repeat-containing protein